MLLLWALLFHVPVNAPQTIDPILMFTFTVTVPPPLAPSNVATSPAFFGTPPVAAHAVPPPVELFQKAASVLLSQVPVPPTQKQVAASAPVGRSNSPSSKAMRVRADMVIYNLRSLLKPKQ